MLRRKSHFLLAAFLLAGLTQASWAYFVGTYSCGQDNPNATQCARTTRSWSISCGAVVPAGGGAITYKCLPETDPKKPKKTDMQNSSTMLN